MVCEGQGWSVPVDALARVGDAERDDNPAAAALRVALRARPEGETPELPTAGWIEVDRDDAAVRYAVLRDRALLVFATIEQRLGWELTGFGDCQLTPQLPPGAGPASFRVAPGSDMTERVTELDVLVTELACSSGRDARGRILTPVILPGDEAITIILAVLGREGPQECPGNPETPFTIELPEPLGGRMLLDGSEIPLRDATTCPAVAACP